MQEDLINLETAKLAKEKGFDIWNDIYDVIGNLIPSLIREMRFEQDWFPAPTQSLLQKWLREKHNLHIEIHIFNPNVGYSIKEIESQLYVDERVEYKTYEEALEVALFEALKLIKPLKS